VDIIFLAHRPPFPPDKGDKIRSYNIIRHLAGRGARVHVLAPDDGSGGSADSGALRDMCASVGVFPASPAARKARAGLSPLCGRPMSVGYFKSPGLGRRFEELMREVRPEAVFSFCSPMAQYPLASPALRSLRGVDRPLLLLDLVDVDSEKWREYARTGKGPMRSVHALEGRLLGKYEERLCEFFDAVFLVSEPEADLLRRRVHAPGNILGMSNGVDLEWFKPGDKEAVPWKMTFCGAMDYPPNIDAVRWFAREVLPLIRREIPLAAFEIVGRDPAPDVRELAGIEGVTVVGETPDVRPYVWSASLAVAPLRIARGIQNKVLEAMAMGKATLCTPEAFEGLSAAPGADLAVEKADPRAFARTASRLLRDGNAARNMGLNARKTMERGYRWNACLSPLDRLLDVRAQGSAA